ncbi:MAG: hypothetical protein C0501_21240 [Isosphaera sp.]|nr:hypothetical protein [Isosphaera sp.]
MPEVTYHQLDTILREYGFSVSVYQKDTRVYKHPATGALLAFPILPADTAVRPHHMVGTRMTLDAFGIADPPEFAARLQQAG